MRLLDRILTEGYTTENDAAFDQEQKHALDEILQAAHLVVIDNVAAYYFRGVTAARCEALSLADLPCVMPPLNPIFLDMRIPAHPIVRRDEFDQAGILGIVAPRTFIEQRAAEDKLLAKALATKAFSAETVAFYLLCTLFLWDRSIRKVVYAGSSVIPIDKEGAIVAPGDEYPSILTRVEIRYENVSVQDEDLITYFKSVFLYPCLLALSFMHCKNVKMAKEVPPPKLFKRYKKETGKSLLRYRVLQIDHMKEILEREGKASEVGLRQALHICRGHFNVYKDEEGKRLFGKYAGRFWIPMHTRGSEKQGAIIKDYNVK